MIGVNKNIIWQLIGTLTAAFSQLIVTIIAAHSLNNSEISFISIITLSAGFVSIFIENGLQQYFIKNGVSENKHSGIYCLNACFCIVSLLVVITYSYISKINALESFSLLLLPCSLLFSNIYSIGTALNYRDKKYKQIALYQIYSRGLSLIILVALIIFGMNNVFIYSLNYFLNYFIIALLYRKCTRGTFAFAYKPENLACIKYSMDIIFSQFFIFARSQLDVILVNIFFSKDIVASYFLVKQLTGRVIDIIASVYIKEAFPKLCSVSGNAKEIVNLLLKNNKYYVAIQAFFLLFILVFNDFISHYLLNREPEDLKLYFISATLVFFIRSIPTIIPSVCLAMGESRVVLKWNFLAFLITTSVSIVSATFGYQAYILSMTLLNVILYVLIYLLLLRKFVEVKLNYLLYDLAFILFFVCLFLFGFF